MEENFSQDKIIQNEILLQALSLKLAEVRHIPGAELEVKKLVELRRQVYLGKVKEPLLEISKLH